MSLIFLFRKLVTIQVLLGVGAFCMAERNPGLLLVAGSLGLLAWHVVEGPSGKPLKQWMITLGVLASVIWLVFDLYYQRGQVMLAMGHFVLWLQVLMLYGRKSNREYAQILVLSLLLMIAGSMLSDSMLFGVMLVIYCIFALFTVLIFQLKTTSDMVLDKNKTAAPKGTLVIRPKAVVTRGHRWHFRITATGVGLICATIGAVVFLLMPRSDRLRQNSALTSQINQQVGFSDEIRLGGPPPATGSREAILSMSIRRNHQVDTGGSTWLVRGAVLDQYSAKDTTWYRHSMVKSADRSIEMAPGIAANFSEFFTQPSDEATAPNTNANADDTSQASDEIDQTTSSRRDAGSIHASITLRAGQNESTPLFTLYPTTHLTSTHIKFATINPWDQRLMTDPEGNRALVYDIIAARTIHTAPSERVLWPDASLPEDADEQNTPKVQANADTLANSPYASSRRSGQRRARFGDAKNMLTLTYARDWPVQPERVRRLARSVIEPLGLTRQIDELSTPDDLEIVQALADFLREEFSYDLTNPPSPKSTDPVIQFLFNDRRGHCELFASGLAAMLRTIGLPTRLVTGYYGSEYNAIGGYYVIRQSHAHAWCEVRLTDADGQMYWQPIDATPPAAVNAEHSVGTGWFAAMRSLYEHAEFAWLRSVVSYDQQTRDQMITDVRTRVAKAQDDPESWYGPILDWLKKLPDMWRYDRISGSIAAVISLGIVLGMASLIRILIVRRRRLTALQLTHMPGTDRRRLIKQLRFYLIMLDKLDRHGYVRPSWQTPFGFAEELANDNPFRFDPVIALTEQFYEIRFGHRPLDGPRLQRIKAHLQQLDNNLLGRDGVKK